MRRTTPRTGARSRPTRRSRGGGSGSALAARDRVAPVAPEGAATHAHPWRRLTALVFVSLHEVQHPSDRGAIEAPRFDLIHRQVLFDEGLEYRVEHFVRRQCVAVLLPRAQLRGGLALDGALGYDTAERVAIVRQPIDQQLAAVL